jgi:hypothetical protein
MNTIRTRTKRRGVKLAGAVLAGAAVAAGALTVAFDGDSSGPAAVLAGSGDAPTNTVFIQPTVAGMTMGATASAPATPGTTPEVADAKPAIKAGS